MIVSKQMVVLVAKERKISRTTKNQYNAVSIQDGMYTIGALVVEDIKLEELPLFNQISVDLEMTFGKYPKVTILRYHK